jgi:hypothetical protein
MSFESGDHRLLGASLFCDLDDKFVSLRQKPIQRINTFPGGAVSHGGRNLIQQVAHQQQRGGLTG